MYPEILVPPDQKRVDVKITDYAGESDPGPYPVPENVPIEGWPGYYHQFRSGKVPPLEEVQRGTGGDRAARCCEEGAAAC